MNHPREQDAAGVGVASPRPKRRALRAQPKVARRRLDSAEGYVEFLQFCVSPPGTTLDQIAQRKEAARVAALTASLLPHRDASWAKRRGPRTEESNTGPLHEQTAGGCAESERAKRPWRKASPQASPRALPTPIDLSSELASLSLSGARGPQARENYSALTSIACDEDEVPNMDELSCITSQTYSLDGNQAISTVESSSQKTSAQEVLAWTALSMFLGQPAGRQFAPLSAAKSNLRGDTLCADGGEDAMPPSIEATPTKGRGRLESAENSPAREDMRRSSGFLVGEPRYDSVEATTAGRAARFDDLLKSVCDSGDSSSFDEPPQMVGPRSDGMKGWASPPSADRSDSLSGGTVTLAFPDGAPPVTTSPQPVFQVPAQPSAKKPRGFLERVRLKARLGGAKLSRGLRRGKA